MFLLVRATYLLYREILLLVSETCLPYSEMFLLVRETCLLYREIILLVSETYLPSSEMILLVRETYLLCREMFLLVSNTYSFVRDLTPRFAKALIQDRIFSLRLLPLIVAIPPVNSILSTPISFLKSSNVLSG